MTHPEDKCEKCGGDNVTWFAPSQMWNKYVRQPGKMDPMLCPVCFIKAAEAAGYPPSIWRVGPENKIKGVSPKSKPYRKKRALNDCAICGWAEHKAIHSIITDGPRKGEHYDHAYVPKALTR